MKATVEPAVRRFQPYPACEDSGVEWLGEIPTHWEVRRLRSTVTGCQNGVWGDEPDGTRDLPCVRVADFDRATFRVDVSDPTLRAIDSAVAASRGLRQGDLLLEKSGGGDNQPVGAVVLYDHAMPAVCSNFVARVSIADGYDSRFLAYLHAALYALRINTRHIKQSTGIQNLDSSSYLAEATGLPPEEEQRAIAAFLDRETARIDALVAKKERLIELLQEKRTALITRAVTRGLDPNVPMKDSGVEWLGDVPSHWEVKRIKFIGQIGNGSTPSRDNPEYWGGEYPWLNSSVVNLAEVTQASDFVTDLALDECHLPRIHPPAVLVGITGEGRTRCMATVLRIEATINQHLAFIRPSRIRSSAEYVRRVLQATYQFLRDESGGGGSTKGALTCDQLGNLPIPFPPLTEQRAIAAFLDRETAKLDALVAKVREAIERLKELRSALISAAVTGKIDVRGEVDGVASEAN